MFLYGNIILLLQLKYPLNGQQMTAVEPVLHSHDTAQATISHCVGSVQYKASRRRICGGTSRTEKGFLRALLFVPFGVIPPLLHIHFFIYLSLSLCEAATYNVVNTNTAHLSCIYVRSANVTANRKMSSSSVSINCACQRQSFVGLPCSVRKKS